MARDLENKSVLLIVSGGIAAYKSLELIRLIRKAGGRVRCILTAGGARFVTPLSLAALSEEPVFTDLWSLKDETEIGHIRLSREADIIVVAPASANIIAQIAGGLADDLASTVLLAADKPALLAPAMNHRMWLSPATQASIALLAARGFTFTGPAEGDMACGEHGPGRMTEPQDIFLAIKHHFSARPLSGKTALVTSGPTFEPIDPVRFLGNRSSGKQGHAIAAALSALGADVTLVSGPVALPDPPGLRTIRVETAAQMLAACEAALPADIAVCAAAVSDWRAKEPRGQKIKKQDGAAAPAIVLKENPDILKTLSSHKNRPSLVVGFAAETESLLDNAGAKLARKGCDWIMANLVAREDAPVFGEDKNHVFFLSAEGHADWGLLSKQEIAGKLAEAIAAHVTVPMAS